MKFKILSIMALSTALLSPAVFAAHTQNPWGVGMDFQTNSLVLDQDLEALTVNGSQIKDRLFGVSLFANYRWSQYGAELGFTRLSTVKYSGYVSSYGTTYPIATLNVENYNVYIDGQYFYPINSSFELKGLLGIGVLTTTTTGSAIVNGSGRLSTGDNDSIDSKGGIRVGVGLQHYFTEDFSMDITYKLQTGNSFYSYINIFAVGLTCHL